MELDLSNSLKAKSLSHFDDTVALLTGERPGFDREAAISIGRMLQDAGFYVYEIGIREFCEKNLALIGAMLVVPHAESIPAETAQPLKDYWKQGGHILALGGPLFRELIEEKDGTYQKTELPPNMPDAVLAGKTGEFVIEGLAPTYKVYLRRETKRFLTEPEQCVTDCTLDARNVGEIVCPVPRPYGIGYRMQRRNRFLPLIQSMAEGGRADGRRGTAAFIMLSDTRGHLRYTNGSRPGSASAVVSGSAIGCIGIRHQDLLNIDGAGRLATDLLWHMRRGMYLYEAGADAFCVRPGEKLCVGARILNTTQDFAEATVRFRLIRAGVCVQENTCAIFASPRGFTDCDFAEAIVEPDEYELQTELIFGDAIVDRISQHLSVARKRLAGAEEFVCAKDGGFVLNGAPWRAFGMNYWPLFYPGLEREDYWMGWLDRSNYDPVETDRDLALLESMGINCLFARLDGAVLQRQLPQIKDFLRICENHHMKLGLSWCNAENPLFYQGTAFRRLLNGAELTDNPVLFAHDISWEIGHQFFMERYLPLWAEGWETWVKERYNGIENAEADWGVAIDRNEAGDVRTPPAEQLECDGGWRVKIAAFRRYMDDMLSRRWNDVVTDMRQADPNHLIGYRQGCFNKNAGCILNAVNRHIDYAALEGYTFEDTDDGEAAAECMTRVSQAMTGGKPVIWIEFGLNLIGTSGNSAWSALRWDREALAPYPEKLAEQTAYNERFFRVCERTGAAGVAPWWYAGGFRRVECSDCGMVDPSGELRPVAIRYAQFGRDWVREDRRQNRKEIRYDPDANAAGWGAFCLGTGPVDRNERMWAEAAGERLPDAPAYGEGAIACRHAWETGVSPAFTTPGFGIDSVGAPPLAVGNTLYNGNNPLKYLDAEFDDVEVFIDGEWKRVLKAEVLCVPAQARLSLRARIGNLREAIWIGGTASRAGEVALTVQIGGETRRCRIQKDAPYLAQTEAGCEFPNIGCETSVFLRMESIGLGMFGEGFSFLLRPEG